MMILLYNTEEEGKEAGHMGRTYRLTSPKERRRRRILRIWNIFVMIVGYASIIAAIIAIATVLLSGVGST